MAISDAHAPSEQGFTAVRAISRLLAGVGVGLLTLYATALAANLYWGGGYSIHPLSLVCLAAVGVGTVLVSWRWSVVGLIAGLTILAVVVVAVSAGIGWVSSSSAPADPFNAVGFSAVSGYPTLVGVMMVTISGLRLKAGARP